MIKKLKKQGLSISQIARQVGACRNTVKKYLQLPDGVRPVQVRTPKGSQADPFIGLAYEMIEAGKRSGDIIPASSVYEEIKRQGYTGSLRTLQRCIAAWELRADTEKKAEPLIRFETEAGIQMQVDWVEFPKEGISAFVATLGYSRMSYVEYVSDEKVETLIECHKNAFEYFGGVVREGLYDNMKSVILQRNYYGKGKHRFHPLFQDFAKHYGFEIRMCRPYRAKTKGKVERFNRYLRHSFHQPLKAKLLLRSLTLTKEIANAEVAKWLNSVANTRIHQSTFAKPIDLLNDVERDRLMRLPFIDYTVASLRIHEELQLANAKPQRPIPTNTVTPKKKKSKEPPISLDYYDLLIPTTLLSVVRSIA